MRSSSTEAFTSSRRTASARSEDRLQTGFSRLTTGTEAWSAESEGWVWAGPAVNNGSVFYADLNGTLYAVSAETGEPQWSVENGDIGLVQATPIVVDDLVDEETGEVIVPANSRVTDEVLAAAEEAGIDVIGLAFPDWDPVGEILHQTLEKDTSTSQMGARMEIYRRQRPGEPPAEESVTTLFNGLFFDERKYDLSQVGRFKFNAKLALDKELEQRILDEQFL